MSYDTLVASTARAYWRMTYGGGTEPDAAGGDDPGTWQSAAVTPFTLSSSGAPLDGDFGDNGIRLHGSTVTERMDVPTLNGDAIFTGGFTLEAWHREPAGANSNDMCIMGWWVNGAGGPMLYIDSNHHYRLTTHLTFSDYLDAGVALTGSVWNHVVGTFDGVTYKLYVNGTLLDSKLYSVVGIGGSPTIPFRVGAYGNPIGGNLNGQLASAAVYQRALSAAEVTQRYNLGRISTGTVLDDFNRADGDIGANWGSPATEASTYSRPQIESNAIRVQSGLQRVQAYWLPTTFGADQYASIRVAAVPGNADAFYLLLCVTSPGSGLTNSYVCDALVTGTPGNVDFHIYREVNGAYTTVATVNGTLIAGSTFSAQIVGNVVSVLVDGAVVATYNDSSRLAAGAIGFGVSDTSTGRIGRLDDFGGGTIGVAGSTYNDAGSGVQPHVGGAADATSLAETASGIVVLAASAADATSPTETGAGTSPRTAGGSKVVVTGGVVYTKTVLGIVTMVGSAPAGMVYTKTASGVVTFVGNAVDVSLHAETGNGVLVRSGKGASSVTSTVVPNAPTELIANVDGKNILLTWAVPVDTSSYVSMETDGHVVMENAGGEVLLETSASELFVVAHYNVHRSKNAGFALSSSNMIAQPTGTSYVDVVPNEGTYHYKVTAVNASGGVSSASNEVIAVVVSVGRTLSLGPAFELELIGKNALELIKQHLDDEIAMQEDKWASLDSHFGYKDLTIERIEALNYYHGHRPSLIDAPPENYPNVCVMAWQANAQPELLDEFNRYLVNLFAEIMCKSETDEEEVNSRIQRTAEAVHACVMKDRSLGGIVFEVRDTPNVLLTDVFARPEVRGHGERFYWQGARLEYAVEKFARI